MSNIGIMEGAFFVGRKEVMDWVNSTLDLNLAKIEDTASGAVACQLLDIMHPGQVPMHKVNWSAKQDFEFVANYKILQTCFLKLKIERMIDVDRLISGRYMDNLEFMQWFKRFFEMSVSSIGDYDAVAQRSKGKGGAAYGGGKRPSSIKPSSAPSAAARTVTKTAPATKPTTTKPPASHAPTTTTTNKPTAKSSSAATSSAHSQSGAEVAALRAAEAANREVADLKNELATLGTERDFYFGKLRDVEVLLQEVEDKGEGNDLTAAIMKILYATAEGFDCVDGAADEEEQQEAQYEDEEV